MRLLGGPQSVPRSSAYLLPTQGGSRESAESTPQPSDRSGPCLAPTLPGIPSSLLLPPVTSVSYRWKIKVKRHKLFPPTLDTWAYFSFRLLFYSASFLRLLPASGPLASFILVFPGPYSLGYQLFLHSLFSVGSFCVALRQAHISFLGKMTLAVPLNHHHLFSFLSLTNFCKYNFSCCITHCYTANAWKARTTAYNSYLSSI